MNKKIILASASPRRRELLTQIGLDFDVVVSETEEKITSTEPAKVVEELSAQKAEAVWEKLAVSGVCEPEQKSGETTMTDTLVLGADTVVACDGKILGKPADTEAAAAMLTMLQGRGHEVYTGVTILYEENGERKTLTSMRRPQCILSYDRCTDPGICGYRGSDGQGGGLWHSRILRQIYPRYRRRLQ